ncbi:MAG TPA: Qat anti-phage system QueC-like protein QatC [Tissierellaceae bacterium]
MIKIWINKQEKSEMPEDFSDAIVFNLLRKDKDSNIKTNIESIWERFNLDNLNPINEDLLLLSLAVMAIDKQIPRAYFNDRWTREFLVSIPVYELDKWNLVKSDLQDMLDFLTGDRWVISFRKSDLRLRTKPAKKKNIEYIKNKNFDGVCLFSGGLDSFCGALKLMDLGKNIIFAGYKEHNKLESRQRLLYSKIKDYYKENNTELMLLRVRFKRGIGENEKLFSLDKENTTRSRSFMFISIGLSIASILGETIPVYIPENGFIGINVPLTDSRSGSCSTRTTHPYFINLFSKILENIGIKNKIINFYSGMTKGEIIQESQNNPVFKKWYSFTLSCAHPYRYPVPTNCGYCYPCIIRKAALSILGFDNTNYRNVLDDTLLGNVNKGSHLRAILLSLNEYFSHNDEDKDKFLQYKLLKNGILSIDELDKYKRIYEKTMDEIYSMIEKEEHKMHLFKYLGNEGE